MDEIESRVSRDYESKGLAWVRKPIMIKSKNSKRQREFHIEKRHLLEKKNSMWIKMDLLLSWMWYKRIWSYMWCKDEELEFGNRFLGTKLGEEQLWLCRATNARVMKRSLGSTWRILVMYGVHVDKYQSFLNLIMKKVTWTKGGFHSTNKVQDH
jgi:hypothetical protein